MNRACDAADGSAWSGNERHGDRGLTDGGGESGRAGQHGPGRCGRTGADIATKTHCASASAEMPSAATARAPRPASPETLRLYAADWAAFEDWCDKQNLVPLPAGTTSVSAFLSEGVATLSAGALMRRAAAISAKHRQNGLVSPAADPMVAAVLRVARQAATPRRAPARMPATLIRMAVRCPRDLAGMRDRALLLLVACGLGRAALVGLDVEHIRFTATGVELSVGAGKAAERAGEEEGRGPQVIVGCAADRSVCPVQALRDWLDGSQTRFGPVFRKIDRWGTLEHHQLGADAIRRILARRSLRRSSQTGSVSRRPRKRGAG
jgi:hypothetical protein